MNQVRLLIDCDTGIDDALALTYLCSLDHVQIEAVTSTPGNVDVEQVAANNLALLQLCGKPDIPVLIGARKPLEIPLVTTPETHGPQGVGYATLHAPAPIFIAGNDAVDYWIEAARANPGELTVLLSAPLTNYALALRTRTPPKKYLQPIPAQLKKALNLRNFPSSVRWTPPNVSKCSRNS